MWFPVFKSLSVLLVIVGLPNVVHGRVRCFSIFDCQAKVREGSECIDGYCSNPYHRGGCLAQPQPDDEQQKQKQHRIRVCHSEDPPEAVELGYCQPSPLNYPEIRIASQNWESVFFETWILQIFLSEVLGVPVTVETGVHGANVDFYDINTSFSYGKSNDWAALETAMTYGGDCRLATKEPGYDTPEGYIACAHVVPEVWTGHSAALRSLTENGIIEPPAGLGALGSQGWYIPRYTAERDTTLLTYLGLQHEKNRLKLAQTFLRPTTWKDYCDVVSTNQCQIPNDVAQRAPIDKTEEESYFVDGSYTGFFRNTTENNCSINPNCTGHIVDYPCGWSSFVSQQAYHLGIAVESNGKEPGSNGYSYSAMTQIWAAANATRNNVMLHWWQPEALYQEYLGTEFEFLRVALPNPTQDCVDHRIDPLLDRCSDDPAVRVGTAAGSCDEAWHSLFKIIGTALYESSSNPNVDEALHSPAHEAVKNFRISDLQLGQIFDYWFQINDDKWNLDPRDAVCRWVRENYDLLLSYVPRDHPRLVEDNDHVYKQPAFYTSLAFASVATILSILTVLITFVQRNKQVMKFAQVEFLFLLLMGLLLVSLGSLLNALPPADAICVSVVWFINFGYTLELVPLIVKVAAINSLMVAARQMRRVELKLASLYGAVLLIAALVGVVLVIWTAKDPPRKDFELSVTGRETSFGETIVERTYYCKSEEDAWNYLGVSWQLLLLLASSVLAFQTRKMREDINETRALTMLIYSHFVFVILRAITFLLDSSVAQSDLAAARSIVVSTDVIATIFIYFVPKFLHNESSDSSPKWLAQATRQDGTISTGVRSSRANVHNNWQHRQNSATPIVSAHQAQDTFNQDFAGEKNSDRLSAASFLRPISLSNPGSSQEEGRFPNYKTQKNWEDEEDTNSHLEAVVEGGEDNDDDDVLTDDFQTEDTSI